MFVHRQTRVPGSDVSIAVSANPRLDLHSHNKHTEPALSQEVALRIAVWAFNSFPDPHEGVKWFVEQAEFLAYANLTGDEARNVFRDIETLCSVVPQLRGVPGRVRLALLSAIALDSQT